MSKKFMTKKPTMGEMLNDLTFRVLYNHYKDVAVNTFKWENLPEGITERYIERTLFDNGKALFFRDPRMSYMCLPCYQASQLDVYGEPLSWRAQGLNYCKEYPREKCVLIENNKLRLPTHDTVMFFVNKMYQAERTMDTNVRTSKVPWVIICDEKEVFTYKEIMRRIDANEPAIFGTKGLNPEAIQLLPTKPEFLGNDLMDYARSCEAQLLTFLGVDNCPVDKKERLITDEAQSNDQLISVNINLMLEARQRAVEEINEMFDLDIRVDVRNKPKEVEQGVAGNDDKGNAGTPSGS